MDVWWIGTISTLAGALTAALLQAWRDRTVYRRQMQTRWDQPLLDGLADYLATGDRAVRALVRWRQARDERQAGLEEFAAEALAAFESLHEKSQVVTLLTGDRDNAVRTAARQMREPLLAMRDEVLGGRQLGAAEVQTLVSRHRDARTRLIETAQSRLGVSR
jgi:hypothetical protein